MEDYKKFLIIGIIVVSLGVVFSINLYQPLETVFIALGSLFLLEA